MHDLCFLNARQHQLNMHLLVSSTCKTMIKHCHAKRRLQPIVKVTPEDQEALTMVRAISSLLPQSPSSSPLSPANPASGQLAAEVYPLLVEVLPGLSRTGGHIPAKYQ